MNEVISFTLKDCALMLGLVAVCVVLVWWGTRR